jgi:NitT/TauT family transport system ATP-binding protein
MIPAGAHLAESGIRFEDVSKVFRRSPRDPSPTVAVDGLSLEVRPGELVALLGKTGCGKSTMFNLIAGLIAPTRGHVLVHGQDPFGNFNWLRGKIAIVFQGDRLLPWRTTQQNVELGLEMLDVPKPERKDRARHWLVRLGLEGHETDYPHALSGGMRQRASIARAFATNASLLLCDEPFSALDELTSDRLRGEFAQLVRENGKTAVFITHRIDEALQIGDRIVAVQRPAKIALDVKLTPSAPEHDLQTLRAQIREVLAL